MLTASAKPRRGQLMKEFAKKTIVGGLLFLLPIALILLLLGYAVGLVVSVIQPFLTSHQLGPLGGVGIAVLALLVLVVISFVAGVVAHTERGARFTVWLENTLLGGIPQYQLVKGMAQGLAHVDGTSGMKPALVSIDGGWQVGYLLERHENGWLTVFLPMAPKAASGHVMYFAADRVRPLGISIIQAMGLVSSFGVGSAAALRGVDLNPPAGNDSAYPDALNQGAQNTARPTTP
jgi:uncharacterized membrane protein